MGLCVSITLHRKKVGCNQAIKWLLDMSTYNCLSRYCTSDAFYYKMR